MPVLLGSKGQPGFAEPIDLMMDCHRRIEHFLGVLRKVADRYAARTLDAEAVAALETSLTYFRTAAPRHTADEEDSLFPRLRAMDDAQVKQALATIDRLESDHRTAEAAHARVDGLGRRWLDHGKLAPQDLAEFGQLIDDLDRTYTEHIALEDERLFVLAKRLLADDELHTIGQEMKQRRS
jgi:hemerythrin-like domain-containing protein